MRLFKLGNEMTVVCETMSTRNGFKHVAHLINEYGEECASEKCCYQNRTWESFIYESVLDKICKKNFDKYYNEMK